MKSLSYLLSGVFVLFVMGFSAWSWVLVDTNFTLFDHADWTAFREFAVSIGYFQRQWSANIYVLFVLALTLVSIGIVRWYKGPIVPLLVGVGMVAGLLSYPALSHDLFNYIFDARILTHYHANPYLHSALDFPADRMLRFMHWVHRTYPYGPTYLLISLVPSLLGSGVFSLTFLLFKSMHVMFYILSGWVLLKMNRKAALIFITSPLIIVEGLMNSHNDFIALALAILGVYLLQRKRSVFASLMFLTSGLIKFISLPVIFLSAGGLMNKFIQKRISSIKCLHSIHPWHIAFGGTMILILYLLSRQEIQPWYFLNVFVFLPFAPNLFDKFTVAITGLLLSYYPYVLGGEWGQGGDVGLKRNIIYISFALNVCLLMVIWLGRNVRIRTT